MTWESPAALWLLAIVPLLLLARRRRPTTRVVVGNLFLWRGADASDAPSIARRFRRSWQVVLQMAAVSALIAALAAPAWWTAGGHVVFIVDRSLSMNALDNGRSRSASALDALRRVDGALPRGTRVRLLAAGAGLDDVGEFPGGGAASEAAQGLEALHVATSLDQALAFAAQLTPPPDRIVVVTDAGRPPNIATQVDWISVGAPLDNAAVSALGVAARLDDPGASELLATVENHAATPLDAEIVFTLNERSFARERIRAPANGRSTIVLALPEQAGIVAAELLHADALVADNVRRTFAPGTHAIEVLVLGSDPWMERALEVNPSIAVRRLGDAAPRPPDVIVCLECPALPDQASSVLFVPAGTGLEAPVPVVTVVSDHPLLAGLDLNGLLVSPVTAAQDAPGDLIATAGGVPIVTATDLVARRLLALRWRSDSSPLVSQPAFPLLVANAIEWLAAPRGPATVVTAGTTRVTAIDERASSVAGVYARAGAPTLVVNPAAGDESNLRRVSSSPAATPVAAANPSRTPVSLTSLFLAGALALLALEWHARHGAAPRRPQSVKG